MTENQKDQQGQGRLNDQNDSNTPKNEGNLGEGGRTNLGSDTQDVKEWSPAQNTREIGETDTGRTETTGTGNTETTGTARGGATGTMGQTETGFSDSAEGLDEDSLEEDDEEGEDGGRKAL